MTPDLPAARAAEVDTYVFRATYAGRRVRVIEALPAAQWLIWLDGVPVSVSSQSLSDFRSERDPEPAPDLGPLFDTRQILTTDDGRHWDTDGREHNLVDVDGEATYVPVTGQKTALGRMTRTQDVLSEVLDERLRQDAKWGEQNHPDGTGQWPESVYADTARMATEHAAEGGYLDWLHILREEVAEAFAEPRPDRLRAELGLLRRAPAPQVERQAHRSGSHPALE